MRILYIHQYFATPSCATGTRSYEFARFLVDRGHQVTMITGLAWLEDEIERTGLVTRTTIDGIDVVAIGVRYSQHMGALRRLWSFFAFMVAATWVARREPCDVVYASSTPLTVGIPGWFAASGRRVPFVFEVRDLWPEAPIQLGMLSNPVAKWAALRLEKYLYDRAARIVALSPGMAQGITARGVPLRRITVIPNCSDTHVFSPGPKDPEMVERWGLEDAYVVGYVGAIGASNDVGQIVEAARIVADLEGALRRTVFLLVGDGRQRPALEARTHELGLTNIVWAGPAPKCDVPRILRTVDVALVSFADIPILTTNSPNKAFDALAAGRPLIVNVGGWIPEMLHETGAGIGATPGDPQSLAEAVIELRDDPERRERMGAAARQAAEERFGRKKLARELEHLLAGAIREAQAAREAAALR